MGRLRSLSESVGGALLIAFHLLTTRILRRWRTTWGATAGELAAQYPGDDLVPAPDWGFTRAVTVDAPPERVWPWIVQIGQGRGGFYSYEGLENLIGCRITNATAIRPDLQHLAVGDPIRQHPKAPPLTVAVLEPNRDLVLHGATEQTGDAFLWSFHLRPAPAGAPASSNTAGDATVRRSGAGSRSARR
ncbi:hypothetical protein [Rhodococcus ruber]|uniref:hypothetical protein n=1 Tax=Rhodococcus ruber TaxID=1830 RepID=UPI000EB74321|nr:hypothetical protein [Rhodococcus ruber]AXY51374.1 hypothetical protein YT1_1940 [Rhodococcus ruber]